MTTGTISQEDNFGNIYTFKFAHPLISWNVSKKYTQKCTRQLHRMFTETLSNDDSSAHHHKIGYSIPIPWKATQPGKKEEVMEVIKRKYHHDIFMNETDVSKKIWYVHIAICIMKDLEGGQRGNFFFTYRMLYFYNNYFKLF